MSTRNHFRQMMGSGRFVCSEFAGTIDSATPDVGDLLRVPAGTASDLPEDEKLTVFAPIDEAFDGNDFAQDSATKALVRLRPVF